MGRLLDEVIQPWPRSAFESEGARVCVRAAKSASDLRDLHRVWQGEHDGKKSDEQRPHRRNEKTCGEEDHTGDRAENQDGCEDRQRPTGTRQGGRERKPSMSHGRTVAAEKRLGSTNRM